MLIKLPECPAAIWEGQESDAGKTKNQVSEDHSEVWHEPEAALERGGGDGDKLEVSQQLEQQQHGNERREGQEQSEIRVPHQGLVEQNYRT